MTIQIITTDLQNAQKNHDTEKVSTLRLLISAIRYFEIAKGKEYRATEDDIESLIVKEAKKRREAIELYQKGNRPELADKEKRELSILENYLPKQLSEDELKELIQEVIEQIHATSAQDIGKVMSAVMPKVAGRADGSRIQLLVKQALTSS